jgi:uncharacterized protein (TIGR01244 family)
MRTRMLTIVAVAVIGALGHLDARQITTEEVNGVRNLKRLETTVACAGATEAGSMPAIRKMGFASVINLREGTEAGVDIAGSAAAAKTVNLKYVHIPFNGQKPDAAAADRFLAEIGKPENQPAFIHCGSGNRAAVMWFIKRLVADKWEVERAWEEAAALGMTSQLLKQWAIDYAKSKS